MSGEPMDFRCSLPEDLAEVLDRLKLEKPSGPAV
jgi:hypothetical protein